MFKSGINLVKLLGLNFVKLFGVNLLTLFESYIFSQDGKIMAILIKWSSLHQKV
jgi:hypothetical protein